MSRFRRTLLELGVTTLIVFSLTVQLLPTAMCGPTRASEGTALRSVIDALDAPWARYVSAAVLCAVVVFLLGTIALLWWSDRLGQR